MVNKPSIIIGKTIMAYGTVEMEGDHETHGSPLPQDEINASKEKLGLPNEEFYLPAEVVSHFQSRFSTLRNNESNWKSEVHQLKNNKMRRNNEKSNG